MSAPLSRFKKEIRVLVATDIAARGIDIDELSHVFNYDLARRAGDLRPPHRLDGRAGAGGTPPSPSATLMRRKTTERY